MKGIRMTAVLLCVALLFVSTSPRVYATDDTKLVVSEASGKRGGTVVVDVTLTAVNGSASGGFNVVYDQTALQLVSTEVGEALSGTNVLVNEQYAADTVRVTFASTDALSTEGVVLRMQFCIFASAAIGSHTVTVERAKLMDVSNQVVPCAVEAGSVTVQAVSMELTSAECVPGQDVALDISLVGDLLPCGGEFELTYDPAKLTSASVNAVSAVGGTSITLYSSVDADFGHIRVTWAAAEPIAAMGKLCSVTFASSDTATESVVVAFAESAFYGEDGYPAASYPCKDGSILFAETAAQTMPRLYLLGGHLASDGMSTVRVVMDAPNIVCGGSFKLSYDSSICTSVAIVSSADTVVMNPTDLEDEEGQITVAWMHISPPADTETILELQFTISCGVSDLLFSEVNLYNKDGSSVVAEVYGGKAGLTSCLQKPVLDGDEPSILSGKLFDATFCEDGQVSSVRAIIAYYLDGQMVGIAIPSETVTFDENGIAFFRFELSSRKAANLIKLFFVAADESFIPMCESVQLIIPYNN